MDLFGTQAEFEQIQKERKRRLVDEYLSGKSLRELRQNILDACKGELSDLAL